MLSDNVETRRRNPRQQRLRLRPGLGRNRTIRVGYEKENNDKRAERREINEQNPMKMGPPDNPPTFQPTYHKGQNEQWKVDLEPLTWELVLGREITCGRIDPCDMIYELQHYVT